MARAIVLLALIAVAACVLGVQAGPSARELEATMNSIQDTLLSPPIVQDLAEADAKQDQMFSDVLAAKQVQGGTMWASEAFAPAHSFAEQEVDEDADEEFGADASVYALPIVDKAKNFAAKMKDLVKRGMLTSTVANAITAMQKTTAAKTIAKPAGKKGAKGKAGSFDTGGAAILSKNGRKNFFAGKGGKKVTKVRGINGNKLKSLQAINDGNSQCFACQYFMQRTLGALLGPFYTPEAAGPPPAAITAPTAATPVTATPRAQYMRPAGTVLPAEALALDAPGTILPRGLILAETDATSFIEIMSLVKEGFYVPTFEEAAVQYAKWAPFLPDHYTANAPEYSLLETEAEVEVEAEAEADLASMVKVDAATHADMEADAALEAELDAAEALEAELDAELETEAEAEVEGPVRRPPGKPAFPPVKPGKPQEPAKAGKSYRDTFGNMFDRNDKHAVRAFFANLCNRRVPDEWQATCRGLWAKLNNIVEELTIGDRPDEVCIRHNFCGTSSYVMKRAHTALRVDDDDVGGKSTGKPAGKPAVKKF